MGGPGPHQAIFLLLSPSHWHHLRAESLFQISGSLIASPFEIFTAHGPSQEMIASAPCFTTLIFSQDGNTDSSSSSWHWMDHIFLLRLLLGQVIPGEDSQLTWGHTSPTGFWVKMQETSELTSILTDYPNPEVPYRNNWSFSLDSKTVHLLPLPNPAFSADPELIHNSSLTYFPLPHPFSSLYPRETDLWHLHN